MFILYISIILVVLGFIFILTSVERRKAPVSAADEEPQLVSVKETDPGEGSYVQPLPKEPADTVPEASGSSAPGKNVEDNGQMFEVVIYNDESGITLENGVIDPSTLKNLSREGRGTADVTSEAVTVRIEKKLFRFDYYRLDRVGGRNDCVVLSVKGAKSSFIMISENPGFYDKVNSEFSRFRG
jgi:hypothetical protein